VLVVVSWLSYSRVTKLKKANKLVTWKHLPISKLYTTRRSLIQCDSIATTEQWTVSAPHTNKHLLHYTYYSQPMLPHTHIQTTQSARAVPRIKYITHHCTEPSLTTGISKSVGTWLINCRSIRPKQLLFDIIAIEEFGKICSLIMHRRSLLDYNAELCVASVLLFKLGDRYNWIRMIIKRNIILSSTLVCFCLSDWSRGSRLFTGFICSSVLCFSSIFFLF